MKPPIFIAYYPDELLYSWILRLSKRNGYANLHGFIIDYINPKEKTECNSIYCRYDSIMYLGKLLGAMDYPDVIQTILDTSLTFLLHPVLRQDAFDKMILKMFYPAHRFMIGNIRMIISDLKACPECMKADKETYGEWYFHRTHQIPGNTVCHIHQCALQKFVGTGFHELDRDARFDTMATNNNSHAFAIFCSEFSSEQYQFPLRVTKTILEKYLDDRGLNHYGINTNKAIAHIFRQRDIRDRIFDDRYVGEYKSVITTSGYRAPELLQILYTLFGSNAVFRKYVSKIVNRSHMQPISDYEILNDTGSILRLKHSTCGTELITTPSLMKMGFTCPWCNRQMSKIDFLDHIIANTKDHSFALVRKNYDLSKIKETKVEVYHKDCGTTTTVNISRIMENERGWCGCEYKMPLSQAQQALGERGFKVIRFEGSSKPIIARCSKCEKDVTVLYHTFIRTPVCPECHRSIDPEYKYRNTNVREKEQLYQSVNALYGNEFVLEISDKKKKEYYSSDRIVVRHVPCGEYIDVSVEVLCNKTIHCPLCHAVMTEAKLQEYINKRTNGQYAVKKAENRKYQIKDMLSGKTDVNLGYVIMREFERESDSTIFPCENKNMAVKHPVKRTYYLLAYIEAVFGKERLFSISDLYECKLFLMEGEKKRDRIGYTLRKLIRLQRIKKVGRQYCLIDQGNPIRICNRTKTVRI